MAAKTSEVPIEPEPAETPPTNVIEALCRVAAEIGGIEKLTTDERKRRGMSASNEKGVTFAYRSIDQVTQAAQPLFARYKVVIVPTLTSYDVKDIVVNGNPWTDTVVTYHWDIYGPDGATDRIEACTAGLGRDNSDKGFGKAMTNAYKNLVLRLLTIGDPQDEGDHDKFVADNPLVTPPPPSPEEQAFFDRCKMVYNLCKDLRNMDGAEGPAITELRTAAGGRSVAEIQAWIERDVDTAETTVKELIAWSKAATVEDAGGEEPPKTRQRRAKVGEAVTSPDVEDAAARVEAAFPGATDA